MIRLPFTAAVVLSLLLCLATAVLWVRSLRSNDSRTFRWCGTHWRLTSEKGRLTWDNEPQMIEDWEQYDRLETDWGKRIDLLERAREQAVSELDHLDPADRGGRKAWQKQYEALQRVDRAFAEEPRRPAGLMYVSHSVSHAVPVALAGLLPVAWLVGGLWRRLSNRPGSCRVCGYDLRASKDRCPECGTPIALREKTANPTK